MAERFGRYWLQEKIGHGGMAEIFRATIGPDPQTYAFDLALKRMHAGLEKDQAAVDMFLTEADVAKFLLHPNLVKVYEAGMIDGRAYIAMEYVWGHDLAKVIDAVNGRALHFPTELAVYVTLQILRALEYVHRAQSPGGTAMELVHRDVTPTNIYVTYNGEVKLGDFGVARIGFLEHHDEDAPVLKGKAAYMPPEVLQGAPVNQAVDLWGTASTLYEMLTGARPFEGTSEEELMHGNVPAKIAAPRKLNADVDARLSAIVGDALAYKTKRRPENALELYRELKLYLRDTTADVGSQALARFVREVAGAAPNIQTHKVAKPSAADFSIPEYQAPVGRSPTQRFEALARERRNVTLPVLVAAALLVAVVGASVWYARRDAGATGAASGPQAPISIVFQSAGSGDLGAPVAEPGKPATSVPPQGDAALAAELGLPDPAARIKALMRRGGLETKKGNHELAAAAFRAAVEARPTSTPARLALARSLLTLRRYPEAEAAVNAAIEAQPKNGAAFLLLGDIMRDRGDAVQARWAYGRAIAVEPGGKNGKAAKKALDSLR
ncbi:MAG: protein kinase [Deltaproteobacteria bacterium]|nr:protein kinase [Deltaproteobacteria bacterium]